jgi:HPt (histidine-containing phosphotransfer) domain-containing protein
MDSAEKQSILQKLGGISEDFYDSLIHDFIAQVHEQIPKLKECLNNEHYDCVIESAHFVKGSAGNLRIHNIHIPAESIEQAARAEKKDRERMARDLEKLEEALAQLEKAS